VTDHFAPLQGVLYMQRCAIYKTIADDLEVVRFGRVRSLDW